MTTYFDKLTSRLDALRRDEAKGADVLAYYEALETELVRDVSLAAEFPGLPPEFRDAVHKTVWACGVFSRPPRRYNPKAEHDDTQIPVLLAQMIWDLHTVFHEVSLWARDAGPAGEPFNDSPVTPLGWLEANARERRETLAEPGT